MDILKLTVKELSDKLNAKELSSLEITKAYLAQIKKVDGDIHAFLAMNKGVLKPRRQTKE
jgi:aspartyl-tRNA(Asn)/glutamyl-tRNA(Gln) amidotransferase subunit A